MAKSNQPKNATITKVNQVFTGREDDLKNNILAAFDLLNRREFQFGTPGESARFKAAYEAIKGADISVENADVKIVTDYDKAAQVAVALALENENGEMEIPDVEDIGNADFLTSRILEYAARAGIARKAMEDAAKVKQGEIDRLSAENTASQKQITELVETVAAAKKVAADLVEENRVLKAENEGLQKTNKDLNDKNVKLYNEANYVSKNGKAFPAKKANRIATALASVFLAGCIVLGGVGIHLGHKNKKTTEAYNDLQDKYGIAITLTEEQQAEIQKLQDSYTVLEGENASLEQVNDALTKANKNLEGQVEKLMGGVDSLTAQINEYQARYEKIVEVAQNNGYGVANDIKMEDLFNAIMESEDKGADEDTKAVYSLVLGLMNEYGYSAEDLTDENGNFTSTKINPALVEIFDEAVRNAKTVADIESIVSDGLEGTGKTREDFADVSEALEFIKENDEKQIAALQEEVKAKEATIAEKEDTIEVLEGTVENLKNTIENLENSGSSSTDQSELIDQLQAQIAENQSTISSLRSSLNSARSSLASTRAALEEAEAERDEALANAASAGSAYDALKGQYDAAIESNEALEDANEQLQAENDSLRDENSALEDKNAALEEALKNQSGSNLDQETPDAPNTDNNSGNVNVGDVDKEDENVNAGQGDKGDENTNTGSDEELGDE